MGRNVGYECRDAPNAVPSTSCRRTDITLYHVTSEKSPNGSNILPCAQLIEKIGAFEVALGAESHVPAQRLIDLRGGPGSGIQRQQRLRLGGEERLQQEHGIVGKRQRIVDTVSVRAAKDAAQGGAEADGAPFQRLSAAYAAIQNRRVAQRGHQAQLVGMHDAVRIYLSTLQQVEGRDSQVAQLLAGRRVPLDGQSIQQLAQIGGAGQPGQVRAQGREGLLNLALRHDVQRLARRQEEARQGKELGRSTEAAGRLARALGDRRELAVLTRIEGQNLICLAQVESMQDETGCGIRWHKSRYVNGSMLLSLRGERHRPISFLLDGRVRLGD